MGLLNTTALAAVLKQKYTQRRFNLLCYKSNPFFALVPKITDFGGKNKVIALRNGVPQGRGSTIAQAQAGKTASSYGAFTVTRVNDYATASITGEAIKASKGDENSLIEGLTKEIDGAIHVCMRSLAIGMFRNGGGNRGSISSATTYTDSAGGSHAIGPSTTTIQLNVLTDITNWEIGMQAVASVDDGTGGAGTLGGFGTVTGVDRDFGLVTLSVPWTTAIPGVAANYFLFQGNAAGTDYNAMIKGIPAWIPAVAPGLTDNFFGFNRSSDVTRNAGIRYTGGGGPIEETLIEAAARAYREGAEPDYVFLNPLDYSNLIKALGSKVIYDRATSIDEPDIGFEVVKLMGLGGMMKIVADLNCPKGTAYMLQLDTWHMESLGEAPMILDFDGNTILRSANSDDYEVRVGYYGNLTNEAPGWNVNIQL